MFEKEAEEKFCKGCKLRIEQCLWAWRHTNGLNEPNEKNCSCKEVPAYITGAEFSYNKVNEWHYVKDGDFPTDKTEKKYLVALKSEYGGFFYETDIWCESLHCFASNNPTKVYAWKEIVLPKEIE